MKKLLAVILIVTACFSFAGCGKDNKAEIGEYEIDIPYYISAGEIKEAKYKLGTNPEEIARDKEKADIEMHKNENEGYHNHENEIRFEEGLVSYHYTSGPFHYYYNKGKEESGISFIAAFDTAFGFSAGSTSRVEIENALKDIDYTVKEATDKDQFFLMFTDANCEMLVCKIDKNELAFYFTDGILMCTTLKNTENWSVEG